jgi:hypothetical protein
VQVLKINSEVWINVEHIECFEIENKGSFKVIQFYMTSGEGYTSQEFNCISGALKFLLEANLIL